LHEFLVDAGRLRHGGSDIKLSKRPRSGLAEDLFALLQQRFQLWPRIMIPKIGQHNRSISKQPRSPGTQQRGSEESVVKFFFGHSQ
jgi:hypothetical protein